MYKKILLLHGGYIGDLILATVVLRALKSRFPDAKIGFVVGSWAREVVENHTCVDWIHTFDHPALNRTNVGRKAKKRRGSHTWRRALQEIKEKEYDFSIDLYYFSRFNAAHLPFFADIPQRAGFEFSYSRSYFNQKLYWLPWQKHMIEQHTAMLAVLEIEACPKPYIEYSNTICEKIPSFPYILIHMGVGDRKRERAWPLSSWKELIKKMADLNVPLFFIGRGNKEREAIEEAITEVKVSYNMCDQLSWRLLIPYVKNAHMVVGMDSMTAHLAAALQVKSVFIYKHSTYQSWYPYDKACHVVLPPEAFKDERITPYHSPLHRITAASVFEKITEILKEK